MNHRCPYCRQPVTHQHTRITPRAGKPWHWGCYHQSLADAAWLLERESETVLLGEERTPQ